MMTQAAGRSILQVVSEIARRAGVFEKVAVTDANELCCAARQAKASYVVSFDEADGQAWVAMRTADRWLSESIEAELMHTGDQLEELIEDELAERDLAFDVTFEHYRDDERRYVFRTPLPGPTDARDRADRLAGLLLAYEAVFGQLGGMSGSDER